MLLTLPPRSGAAPLTLDTEPLRHIVVIGANGAGKTRFADRLAADLGPAAFRLSALKALYTTQPSKPLPGSIGDLYSKATSGTSMLRPDLVTEFDRLLALLINEEILSLLSHKFSGPSETSHKDSATRLERVISEWQRVFPDNKILVDNGRMLFNRAAQPGEEAGDNYAASRLSDGEKTVLYYLGAVTYAPRGGVIIVDSPAMFLHPSSTASLWNSIETLRPDCTFIYLTHDLQFASTRGQGCTVWVKSCDPARGTWDYDFLTSTDGISDEVYLAIIGARKPVLFIEGDGVHSIDARLYPLIFNDYTVKSLGGCDRVIEATRTFNSLRSFHNLNAFGIVDRDRRDEGEVAYLHRKQVFVPDVAEIENIFMLEGVIRTMARLNHRDPDAAFAKVKRNILHLFEADLRSQALQHTRHRMKKGVEHRIDGRFANINQLEAHIAALGAELRPRQVYEDLCREFRRYLRDGDYAAVLRVYNRKTMLSESHVASLVGLRRDDKDVYISTVLNILTYNFRGAAEIRDAIRSSFPPSEPVTDFSSGDQVIESSAD